MCVSVTTDESEAEVNGLSSAVSDDENNNYLSSSMVRSLKHYGVDGVDFGQYDGGLAKSQIFHFLRGLDHVSHCRIYSDLVGLPWTAI